MRPKVLSRMFREAFVANIDERYFRGGLGFEMPTAYNVGCAMGLSMEPLAPTDEEFWKRMCEVLDQDTPRHRAAFERCEAARVLAAAGSDYEPTIEHMGLVLGVEPDEHGLYPFVDVWRVLRDLGTPA